jgi:hypothetical protein
MSVAALAALALAAMPSPRGSADVSCGGRTDVRVSAAADPVTADGSELHPYRTITAAIAQARALRTEGCANPIKIRVAAGLYQGAYPVGSATLETLPILIDVSNVTVAGSTVLATDARGLPTGQASAPAIIEPQPTPGQGEEQPPAFVLVAPTEGPRPVVDVTLAGLELLDPAQSATGVVVLDRVQGFDVTGNDINGGGTFGINTRASSGVASGNYITGASKPGIGVEGGNEFLPASVSVTGNRITHNGEGGVIVDVEPEVDFPTVPSVVPTSDTFDTADIRVEGNDLSYGLGSAAQAGFGVRLMPNGLTQMPLAGPAHLTAQVSDNTIDHNAIGLVIDGGFPYRAKPLAYSDTVAVSLAGNAITNSTIAPAVVTFTRYTATLCAKELPAWKFLEQSAYSISDPDGELNGPQVLVDNPPSDPIGGLPLANTLTVNGAVRSPTELDLQTRFSTGPTCV